MKIILVAITVLFLVGCSTENTFTQPTSTPNPTDPVVSPVDPVDPVDPVVPPISRPLPPPDNLRITAYTDTEVEVFWDASPTENVVGYDVYKNGELVAQRLDAKSYYDNQVNSNENVTYTIITINDKGQESSFTNGQVMVFVPAKYETINVNNYRTILSEVLSVVNGEFTESFPTEPRPILFSGREVDEIIQCNGGGTIIGSSSGNLQRSHRATYKDCDPNSSGELYNGTYTTNSSVIKTAFLTGFENSHNYNLTIGKEFLSGNMIEGDFDHNITWDIDTYKLLMFGGDYILEDLNMLMASGYTGPNEFAPLASFRQLKLDANFKLQSKGTGNKQIRVSTSLPLMASTETSTSYDTGKFVVTSSQDGSRMEANAVFGANQLDVLVVDSNGTILVSEIVNLTGDLRLRCLTSVTDAINTVEYCS